MEFNTGRENYNIITHSMTGASLRLGPGNYLREYNTQLSRFVFYLNRHIPTNLSKLSICGELHAFKIKSLKLPDIIL